MPISQSCSQHPTSDFFFGGGRNFKNHKEQHKYFFRLSLKHLPALEASHHPGPPPLLGQEHKGIPPAAKSQEAREKRETWPVH